jgi:glycosyltransferase involved in cell wall biosynthesis
MDDESDLQQALAYAQRAYEALAATLEAERRAAEGRVTMLRAQLATLSADHQTAQQRAAEFARWLAARISTPPEPAPRLWRRPPPPVIAPEVGAWFEPSWYLQRYPDVAASGQDAAQHFARFGVSEGRAPGAWLAPDPPAHHDNAPQDIVFVSGEPGTPGHIYRVRRPTEAASAVGLRSRALSLVEAAADPALLNARIVVIWRAAWNDKVASVFAAARAYGARIVFDVDDLMFEPELAKFEFIDGIRTQFLTEKVVADFYALVQQTLLAADACLSPTVFLTERMQRFGKPGFVLPNGFDATTKRVSAAAVAARHASGASKWRRIGYAGGTRTHQKDFAVIATPLAALLREHPNTRLVLFRRAHTPCLDIAEFPALSGLEAQIEWREMVGLEELPWELARFDINLAPLEVNNPYCEAKSELKFFEAALVEVPTIASPTRPFRDAIRDGENGFLAADDAAWYRHMTTLLHDPDLRLRAAQAALADIEERYGVSQRAKSLQEIVGHLART